MKKINLVMIMVLLLGVTTWGAPLKKEFIGSDAKWVIHADYEAFAKTKLSAAFREELKIQGVEQQLVDLKSIISFHLIDDIKNVTIYGTNKDESTVVAMIQGNFDSSKLVSLVNTKPSYKEVTYKTFSISSWEDQNGAKTETSYGSFFDSGTLLLSKNKDKLVNGLDTLSLGEKARVDKFLLRKPENGTFILATGKNINDVIKDNNDETFFINIGEKDGKFFIVGNIIAKTKEEATTAYEAIQGGVAMAKLAIPDEMMRLKEVVNAIKVLSKNRLVDVSFKWDSIDLVSVLKESDAIKKKMESTTTK